MNWLAKVNLWLAAAVLVAASLNWLEPGLHDYVSVTRLQPDQVDELKLIHRGELRFSLHRDQLGWHGAEGPVDQEIVEQLLKISQLPSLYRFQLSDSPLERYGLATPVYRLQFNEVSLSFGDTDPVTKLRYLAVDDVVHLVSDGYYHYLSRSPYADTQ